ncbi:MAG: Aspartate racemase [Candidatus Accumulibacter regalis]|mgnify:FL=1|uniref:Aspartate racemase n=1 Tax=Accumulibacter regalis TaxID=522306 RepID=A0A011QLB9_ACCRE|nr:aspartate/glutamate racemase family protein [Accumulibacter sp.]EXI90157.1 MAG: Aspartate racemase [Candidatus Accumulibacter regalis]HRE72098.1 aspartate/glutamate racemase family protein [Accumulibacter sp.]
MKTIGLIGGMSWQSTIPYYRIINETVQARLGGLHSARLLLHSVDFQPLEDLQRRGDWNAAGEQMAQAARSLAAGGADFLVLCTNTMHRVASAIDAAVALPLLHIADATGDEIDGAGFSRVGLLGTRFTMEQTFYRERLQRRRGIDVVVPAAADREIVHRVIYEELCVGQLRPSSRAEYRRIIGGLVAGGAQAVVLGCTEISLLITAGDAAVPLFDTTRIHARAAAERALADS